MLKKIFDFINDNELKITYYDNKLDIINYKKILIVEDNKIKIDCHNIIVIIKGSGLTINRLYNEELLIDGVITSILFGDSYD